MTSPVAITPQRFGGHKKAFGFLRLLFVIVSHTPELADGDRHRELLTLLFGSISFGELAVGGFFIISGFLIKGSYENSRTVFSYLKKRTARIYPGYAVAFLVSVFIFAPLGGAVFSRAHELVYSAGAIPTLQVPSVRGVFVGQPYPLLNGSMWTIAYEFRCYVLLLVLGSLGLLRRAWPLALAAALLLVAAALMPEMAATAFDSHPTLNGLIGRPLEMSRFTGLFLAGAAFYLAQRRIPLGRGWAGAAAALLCLALCSPLTANFGLAFFGSYLIFYAAEAGSATWLARIGNDTDVSYGLYLYAWPILNCGIRLAPAAAPLWLIGVGTWLLACGCGWLSWTLLECHVMNWIRPAARSWTTPSMQCELR